MKYKIIANIASIIISLAWIPLFMWNWKVAGLIMLVMWANNLMLESRK